MNNRALVGAQNGLGIDGRGLTNYDGSVVVGEVLAIVAVLDVSTSGSASQGNREVLLKGSAILRIKHGSIYIDNRSLTALNIGEGYFRQEIDCLIGVAFTGVIALIAALSSTIEIG